VRAEQGARQPLAAVDRTTTVSPVGVQTPSQTPTPTHTGDGTARAMWVAADQVQTPQSKSSRGGGGAGAPRGCGGSVAAAPPPCAADRRRRVDSRRVTRQPTTPRQGPVALMTESKREGRPGRSAPAGGAPTAPRRPRATRKGRASSAHACAEAGGAEACTSPSEATWRHDLVGVDLLVCLLCSWLGLLRTPGASLRASLRASLGRHLGVVRP